LTAEVIDLDSIRNARIALALGATEPPAIYGNIWPDIVGLGCAIAELGCVMGIELMLHSGIPQAPCDVEQG
jgi:hypothetical protein